MVRFESRNPLAIVQHGRLAEASEFAAIQERLKDALLDVLIAGGDALQFLAEGSQVLHALVDVVVLFDIIGRRFDAKHIVVSHIDEIQSRVGAGGMGDIKISNQEFSERFGREAPAIASSSNTTISHPTFT